MLNSGNSIFTIRIFDKKTIFHCEVKDSGPRNLTIEMKMKYNLILEGSELIKYKIPCLQREDEVVVGESVYNKL